MRQVTYPSGGRRLPAWFVAGDADTWAVLVHGKGGSVAEMHRLAGITSAAGLPTLSVAYRNDPGAPQEADGRYGYGNRYGYYHQDYSSNREEPVTSGGNGNGAKPLASVDSH